METQKRKVSLSGVQSSGTPQLGNYIGAIRQWPLLQDEYDCIYFVADAHALTVRRDPKLQHDLSQQTYALLLATGIDPEKSLVFIQNQVPEHFELAWILNCYSYFGELSRMTQFKDKSQQNPDNVNAGLFTYPALMAADVLIYQTDIVPVGEDQKQHVELTRTLANRFNNAYGETFVVPEPVITKEGARIMSLQDPTSKMSKTDPNLRSTVFLDDEPDDILKKFRSAMTDSDMEVRYRPGVVGKEGITNLLTIYTVATGKTMEQAEKEFDGKGYGDFKSAVGEAVVDFLAPVQEKYKYYMSDLAELERIYRDGAQRASQRASVTLQDVKSKLGLLY